MDEQAALARMCKKRDVSVKSDAAFQRQFRLMQALWREEQGLAGGTHRDKPLGSLLAMPMAEQTLANYLTDTIRDVVRHEVEVVGPAEGKLYGQPRIYDNLLSSQPLCFNLFGELAADAELATAALRPVWPDRIATVTSIAFEWSPGRQDKAYLGNNTAFDVVVFHTTPEGGKGFIGIEVKYHENMRVGPVEHRARYDEVAAASEIFGTPYAEELAGPPMQQVWLDHLLALSMLQADPGWDEGLFVVLAPIDNVNCERVALDYEGLLLRQESFVYLTMEEMVEKIAESIDAPWLDAFVDRYLDVSKVDRLLDGGPQGKRGV